MKLTLLRHGLTEGNRSQLCYGRTDLPLLPEGIEALQQAVQTMDYPTAQHYYTSGMRRTEETFALLYGDTPREILAGLREADFFLLRPQSGQRFILIIFLNKSSAHNCERSVISDYRFFTLKESACQLLISSSSVFISESQGYNAI